MITDHLMLSPTGVYIQNRIVDAREIDPYGHVNNAVYPAWLDQCTWAHAEQIGIGADICRALDRGLAVTEARLKYLAPARAGEVVSVATWIAANDLRLRGTRKFVVSSGRRTLLRAEYDYVSIELSSLRPVRMPALFAALVVPVEPGSELAA